MNGDLPDGVLPDDPDLTAAEYVAGLLTAAEAREVEARAIGDPTLARGILDWQRRLSGLARLARPEPPPDSVWQRLAAVIDPQPATSTPAAQPTRRRLSRYRRRVGTRTPDRRMMLAHLFAGGMIGAAVAFAIVLPKMAISLPAVASLNPVGTPVPAFLVMVTKDGFATIIANAADVQPGNSLELWGLPQGATTPIRLALLPTEGRLRIPAIVPIGTELLVSQEPKGGSPTGQPTGPVVYRGRMVKG